MDIMKSPLFPLFSGTRKLLNKRPIKNFAWVVAWEITKMCNLRCQYCWVEHEKSHGDIDRAMKKVIELGPHFLLISGGEPLMVPQLDKILEKVNSACNNPEITLTTNLTMNEKTIVSVLPFINTLHVSIDGVDGHNLRQRGVSAEKILKNIAAVTEYKKKRGLRYPQLLTATVLTADNYRDFPKLVKRLYSIDPTVIMTVGTVEPYTHPLSIGQSPEAIREFQSTFWQLKKEYPVEAVGIIGNKATRGKNKATHGAGDCEISNDKYFKCYRQFFRMIVRPDGTTYSCKPFRLLEQFKSSFHEALAQKRFRQLTGSVAGVADRILFNPYNPRCDYPCKCEEFVDDIIMAKSKADLPEQASFFKNKIQGQAAVEAENFIRKHFNPDFRMDFLRDD